MTRNRDALIDELEDLLDRERALLLAGQVQDLAQLADYKMRLLSKVSARSGLEGLQKLKAKAERNARLIDAAGRGIKSVSERIAALKAGPRPFSTYGANGDKSVVGGAASTIEKRA